MIVLGIDPGTARTGYGIIEELKGKQKLVTYGCIETSKDLPVEIRLKHIYDQLNEVFLAWPIEAAGVEKVFFNKNVKTANEVNQARGVILLSCANKQVPVREFTPTEVKQAIIGNGSATKKQVQYMIKMILSLQYEPKPDDAADALALAVCCLNYSKYFNLVGRQ